MEKIRLLPDPNSGKGKIIDVADFENETHKNHPYFQNGGKYAICPTCGSSVQLIGGGNNSTGSSNTKKLYAAHTRNNVNGFNFSSRAKSNCPNYSGNKNNWQGIYQLNLTILDNEDVREYISEYEKDIAKELWSLTGIRFNNQSGVNNLFTDLRQSFESNNGLKIDPTKFVPEFVPRLLIEKANPITIWGNILSDDNKLKVENNEELKDSLIGNQFRPSFEVNFVGELDNLQTPKYLIFKLLWGNNQLELRRVSANIL
ncbi:hypothetical protein [Lysinibacillus xylanilyticus]|uniref:hypothetical protein n=1 Tax=Lysinibacillus xylanilyticus TaxID=582475 RepID=UPI0038037A1D